MPPKKTRKSWRSETVVGTVFDRFFRKEEQKDAALAPAPCHVGIIMDGNGRWAKKRGMPRKAGHAAGAKVFREVVKYSSRRGVRFLTVYAFSTENWKRPQDEVDSLMDLLRRYLVESLEDFRNENIHTCFIGERAQLAPDIQKLMAEAEETTAHKTGMTLNIAINYGGQQEITHAARELAKRVERGELRAADITEDMLQAALYTGDQPPVDLVLRPSGEYRLSNFLVWQSAYAEFVFMDDILWPDFKNEDLDAAFAEFARRNRRFGGV